MPSIYSPLFLPCFQHTCEQDLLNVDKPKLPKVWRSFQTFGSLLLNKWLYFNDLKLAQPYTILPKATNPRKVVSRIVAGSLKLV